jgi:protein-tyrosine phosphatase
VRRIRPTLFVGPAAHPQDIARLKRAGVTAVLSLQEPVRDLPQAVIERIREACGDAIVYRNLGVRDYDPHDLIRRLPAILAALAEMRRGGHVIYVHCCEGVNRSPSVALAYLVRLEGMEVDEALAHLRRVDPAGRPYREFVDFLRTG